MREPVTPGDRKVSWGYFFEGKDHLVRFRQFFSFGEKMVKKLLPFEFGAPTVRGTYPILPALSEWRFLKV
jgi:hypothetical protein